MKKTLLLSVVALLFTALSVKAQSPTINVVCGFPETLGTPFDAGDTRYILNSLDGLYTFSFNFDLYPANDLVDGQTYTLSDMSSTLTYVEDRTNGTTSRFSSLNFVRYRDGSIVADVTSTVGRNYHVTYTWVPITNPTDTVTLLMTNVFKNRAYDCIDDKGYIYLVGWTEAQDYNLNIAFYTTTFADSYSFTDRHTDYNHCCLKEYLAPGHFRYKLCHTILEATVTGTDSACTAHIKWVDIDSTLYDITFVYSDPTPDTYHTFTASDVTAFQYSRFSNKASDFRSFDGTNTIYATVLRTASNLTGTWDLEKSEDNTNKINICHGWRTSVSPKDSLESFNGTITVSQAADGSYTLTGSALMYDHSLWTFYCSSLSPITQPTDTVTVAMSNANHMNRAYDLIDDKGVMKLVGLSDDGSYEMALAFNTTSFAGSYSLADKYDPDFHLSHIAPDGKKSLLYCNNILEATVTGTASSCTAHIKWVDADSTMYDITFAYDDPTPVYHQTFTATDLSITTNQDYPGVYAYDFLASDDNYILSGTLFDTNVLSAILIKTNVDDIVGTWNLADGNIRLDLLDATTGDVTAEPFDGTITVALTDDSLYTLNGTVLFYGNTEWTLNCSFILIPKDTIAIAMDNAELNYVEKVAGANTVFHLFGADRNDEYRMELTAFADQMTDFDKDNVSMLLMHNTPTDTTTIEGEISALFAQGDTTECTVGIEFFSTDTILYNITFTYKKLDTEVDNVNETICTVFSEGNTIVIRTAEGQDIIVNDIAGRTIISGKTSSDIERVNVPMPGIYTVCIGNRTLNVLVK